MPSWSLVDSHPTQGRTFQRPLGLPELAYLWEGLLNGSVDSSHHYELRLSNSSQDLHLFSEENIAQAWVSTKRRFPLVGAIVRGADGDPLQVKVGTDSKVGVGSSGFASEPHFVVREYDLGVVRPGEIVFRSVTSAEEAQAQAAGILHGARLLSEELMVQLYIFRETNIERVDVLHLVILVAHCVTDGMATRTLVRCLLDTLARGGSSEPAQTPLEQRLAIAVPPMDLEPASLCVLSPVIRRWRRAVGTVIHQLRTAKRQGGHTLPYRPTHSIVHGIARSGRVSTTLTHTQTAAVIASCRLHGMTFGHAYLVLAQIARTRVLYRQYLRGEISEEEWAHRMKQPYINRGPLNLRPYLDKAWFDNGGGGEFVLSISLFTYQLPFMTLGGTEGRRRHVSSDGPPPFPDLLSFDRFLHRVKLVKKQATAFFSHPLFVEIVHAEHLACLRNARLRALRFMQRTNGHDTHGDQEDEDKVPAVALNVPVVYAHGGSSLGNLDLISPSEYPLPPTHPLSPYSSVPHPVRAGYATPPSHTPSEAEADTTPKIVLQNSRTHLRMRSAELYVGAATLHGRMNMYIYYDGNVFEDGVVREWMEEVEEAVLWYLGRSP